MGTTYQTINNVFLGKISDFDLPGMLIEDAEEILYDLMISAITRFQKVSKSNLSNRNDKGFIGNLSDVEIDILTEIMVENWLKPKLYNTDLLKNGLSTKDFSVFSPANLLNAIRNCYELAHSRSESLINKYSFDNNSLVELKNDLKKGRK